MHVYLMMLLTALLLAKQASRARPYPALVGTYRFFAVCSFLPFAVNAVLRTGVGTDWVIYDAYYQEISNGGRTFAEPLFNLINRVLYKISPDSVLLFGVVGFLTLTLFFLGMYRQSEMVTYSILIFFVSGKYFSMLNQIRQMMAVAIFFFAFQYISRRCLKKYVFWIVMAGLIHTSAWIYLPLYFLYGIRWNTNRLIKTAISFCLGLPIILFLSRILVRYTRFAWYLSSRFDQSNFDLMGFVLSFLIFFAHLFLLKRQEDRGSEGMEADPTQGFLVMVCMISWLVYLLSSAVPQVSRIAESLSVIEIISLPNLSQKEPNQQVKNCVLFAAALMLSCKLLYNTYSTQWWYGVLPYHTVFYAG